MCIRDRLHVECLDLLRVIRDEDRALEDLLGEVPLVLGLQIAAPEDLVIELVIVRLKQLDSLGIRHMAEIGGHDVVQAVDEALVDKLVEECHFLRRVLQHVGDDELDHVLGELHVVGEIGKRDLRLDHPELRRVAGRVGVFGAECRAEGIDVYKRQGFSVMATSEDNQAYLQKLIGIQTISYDKVNSLRHVRYLKNKAHTLELMKKHAAILNPKFQCVLRHLDTEIAPLGIASWQRPKGGYFVSVNTAPGLAKRTLALCKEAGVVMTSAGATFPYGRDPQDSNIRIAPSLPPVEELEQAMEIFCTSLRLAALEQRMQ